MYLFMDIYLKLRRFTNALVRKIFKIFDFPGKMIKQVKPKIIPKYARNLFFLYTNDQVSNQKHKIFRYDIIEFWSRLVHCLWP